MSVVQRTSRLSRSILFLLALLLVSVCSFVRAEEPADVVDLTKAVAAPDPKIAKFIAQLGSPDTVLREEAETALMAAGKAAIAPLKTAEASANAEIAARAKRLSGRLSELTVKAGSYAEYLPSDTILYLEFRDTATTFDRLKRTPLSKFWDKQSTKIFMQGFRTEQLPNEVKVLDAATALPKLASGRALFALSSPDTIEAHEIDPPLIYVYETQSMRIAEAHVRSLFEGMNDAVKTKRKYNTFEIEEQINACSVFGAQRIIHALTPKGMETFLDHLKKPPGNPLSRLTADMKTKRPDADIYFRLSADGLKTLAEANQLLDDDLTKRIETFGLEEGGFIEDALTLNAEGIEDFARIFPGGNARSKGLMSVLQRMTVKAAPPVQANQPQALDMVPWQAAMVVSFSGDAATSAVELTAALRALDALGGELVHPEANLNNVNPPANAQNALDPVRPPRAKTAAEEALNLGGGNVLDDKKDLKTPAKDMANKKPGKKADKAAEPERTAPRFERLLHAGFTLEQLLQQVDGPMVLALFPERVDVSKLAKPDAANNPPDPDHVPMAVLVGMYLKDPAPIELALKRANKGVDHKYIEHVLDGGTFFSEDEDENSAGFWLRGNYFAWGTSRDILDLAGTAVLNQNGNERMTARQSHIDYMAKNYDPAALLNVYGDSRQFLEMPYKMAQLQWQTDPKNPFPDFAVAAGLLKGNTMHMKIKQVQGGLQIEAQSPLSLMGMLQAILKPLKEAALIQ
ncbi:MAG: hypothetical protein WCT04_01335 [Planctomycetota bacterium]